MLVRITKFRIKKNKKTTDYFNNGISFIKSFTKSTSFFEVDFAGNKLRTQKKTGAKKVFVFIRVPYLTSLKTIKE
jgi:hypothetical protein